MDAEKESHTMTATEALRARIEKARKMVSALCQGEEKWTMHVPARPDSDPDLVIADGLGRRIEMVNEATAKARAA